MDGWMDGWMDNWMDGWMDNWMDGWMDGWTSQRNNKEAMVILDRSLEFYLALEVLFLRKMKSFEQF